MLLVAGGDRVVDYVVECCIKEALGYLGHGIAFGIVGRHGGILMSEVGDSRVDAGSDVSLAGEKRLAVALAARDVSSP